MSHPIQKELAIKLRDKLSTVQQFLEKCTCILESEHVLSDPCQLEKAFNDHKLLLLEFDDLEVTCKIKIIDV